MAELVALLTLAVSVAAVPVVPLVCLALACGWDAGILLSDDRRLRRLPGRAYRSGLGWLDTEVLNRWRRGYPVPLVAAAGLLAAAVLGRPAGSAVGALACGAVILWVAREGLMPFAIGGVGLLFLATAHPLLAGIS